MPLLEDSKTSSGASREMMLIRDETSMTVCVLLYDISSFYGIAYIKFISLARMTLH